MTKEKIILDTDPGIDDAAAIALALFSEKIDIELITTVSGNVDIEKTTENALKLLTFFDKDIKVAKGAASPLIRNPFYAPGVHGDSGMDGYDFPMADKRKLLHHSALDETIELLGESSEKITIVAIGPLTNIASLLIARPKIKEKIKRIVLMGGSTARGNVGVYTEFNFAVDPEAARIVFESGLDIVMLPLQMGRLALVSKEISEEIKDYNKTGHMLYSIFKHYRDGDFEKGLYMYDLCAIAFLEDEEIFEIQDARVDIETQGDFTSGASLVDFKNLEEKNAKVAVDLDYDRFIGRFKETIKKCI
jgi:non-specific riboncleoside hydrolase